MLGDVVTTGAENPSTDAIGAVVSALGSKAWEGLGETSEGTEAAGNTAKSGSAKGVELVDEFVVVGWITVG